MFSFTVHLFPAKHVYALFYAFKLKYHHAQPSFMSAAFVYAQL